MNSIGSEVWDMENTFDSLLVVLNCSSTLVLNMIDDLDRFGVWPEAAQKFCKTEFMLVASARDA